MPLTPEEEKVEYRLDYTQQGLFQLLAPVVPAHRQ